MNMKILFIFFMLFLSQYSHSEVEKISAIYANKYIGEVKVVCGKVKGTYLNRKSRGDPVYLNFQKDYPLAPFTAIIWTEYTGDEFGAKPEKRFLNKKICIKGLIEEYNGKPQIVLRYANQIVN